MQHFEKLTWGSYYHIYNRGINGCILFLEPANYEHFLRLYEKYIDPAVETFAWCLMPNHFHFLVRIKDSPNSNHIDMKPVVKTPSLPFSHLFNSYAQAFNKRYKRTGALFQTPFKRKLVSNTDYFKELVFYIHNNPVKHGFCAEMKDYPWSSYMTIISFHRTRLQRDKIIGLFDSKANFILFHEKGRDKLSVDDLFIDEPQPCQGL